MWTLPGRMPRICLRPAVEPEDPDYGYPRFYGRRGQREDRATDRRGHRRRDVVGLHDLPRLHGRVPRPYRADDENRRDATLSAGNRRDRTDAPDRSRQPSAIRKLVRQARASARPLDERYWLRDQGRSKKSGRYPLVRG